MMKRDSKSRREAHRRQELMKAARTAAKQFKCCFPGCTHTAIGSHVLQENGVLDQIAEEYHFMEYAPDDPFIEPTFKKKGLSSSDKLIFRGFCGSNGANHDRNIFIEIENSKDPVDYKEYKHQLLTSYRGLCNNYCQEKVILAYYNLVIHDSLLKSERDIFLSYRNKLLWGHKDVEYYKHLMEKELFDNSQDKNFIFNRFELPKIDVAACHIFAGANIPYLGIYKYEIIKKLDPLSADFKPLTNPFFINLIPRPDRLIFLIGCALGAKEVEEIKVEELSSMHEKQIIKLMSDILVRRIDTWALSPSLYERLFFQDKIKQYHDLRKDYINTVNNPLWKIPVIFNLFEGII